MSDETSGGTRCGTWFQAALCCGGLALSGLAAATSPPAPTDVKAKADGHVEIDISFRSDASLQRVLTFESEMTVNGHPAPGYDASIKGNVSQIGDGSPYFSGVYRGLAPNIDYCFRYRARDVRSGETSPPSTWACAHTEADPPPAPTSISASYAVPAATEVRPEITWTLDSRSYDRGSVRCTIERQSPPGPGWPWILQADFVAGPEPGFAVTDLTPFQFARTVSAIDPKRRYVYRVCVENHGGRACTQPVDLITRSAPLGAGATELPPAAAPGNFVSANAAPYAEQQRQRQATSRPSTQTRRPINWGAATALQPSGFPSSNSPAVPMAPSAIGPGARATATPSPHLPVTQSTQVAPPHRPTGATPGALNPQPLPPGPPDPTGAQAQSPAQNPGAAPARTPNAAHRSGTLVGDGGNPVSSPAPSAVSAPPAPSR